MTTDSSDTAGRLSGSSTNSVSASRHVSSSPSGNSTANRKRYKTHLVKLNSIAEVPNIPCVGGGSKQILAQWHSNRTASGATSFNVSTSPDSTADSEDASLQSAVSQHSGESQESSPVNSSNPSSIQEVPMISPISSAQSKRQAFSALKVPPHIIIISVGRLTTQLIVSEKVYGRSHLPTCIKRWTASTDDS